MKSTSTTLACAIAIAACGNAGDEGDGQADTTGGAEAGPASDASTVASASATSTTASGDADAGSEVGSTGGSTGGSTTDGGTTETGFGECADDVWSTLEACGWPGALNTGPVESECPDGLVAMGDDPLAIIEVADDGAVIECADIAGGLHVTGQNVVVKNVRIRHDSGQTGENANGTAVITVDEGGSASIEQVAIDGLLGVHACIWHQGTELSVRAVDCSGSNDGIFTWADVGFSPTTGDNFTIEDSWFHDFTMATSNGHIDGFQTEGAAHGTIRHNTYDMKAEDNAAISIWNSLRDSTEITIQDNLLAGGGATIYVEDYDPSEASPEGGFSVTEVQLIDNTFSTHVSPCVGAYFVWYSRPQYSYGGGPTDGWHRDGNFVLETGEDLDLGNPHVDGQLCT